MGENTKIEWADHTFNPWRGCTKVSEGCENCYAARFSKRNPKNLGVWGDDGTRVVASYAMWKEPFRWNSIAESQGVRHRVFCASFADVFEDWTGPLFAPNGQQVWVCPGCAAVRTAPQDQPPKCGTCDLTSHAYTLTDLRLRFFKMVDSTPHLDWLLVTKRPENIRRLMPVREVNSQESADLWNTYGELYRPNVWLLTSVENQEQANKRIPELLKSRELAPVLGLSCEPLLGPVNLWKYMYGEEECDFCDGSGDNPACFECGGSGVQSQNTCLDWVICGGESGNNARPMHPDWVRYLCDLCREAGVPFFFKQWGEWRPLKHNDDCAYGEWHRDGRFIDSCLCEEGTGAVARVGKKLAGRLLDGVEWNEFPKRMEAW